MKLKDYSDKPTPLFLGKGEWYIGLELEMEAPQDQYGDDSIFYQGLDIKDRPRFCYAKPDSSINYGWELITHPIPYEKWLKRTPKKGSALQQFFELVNELSELGYRSHGRGTCGLHIHICRKAFGSNMVNRNNDHKPLQSFYWFRRLIHGPLFRELSHRRNGQINQWAYQRPDLYSQPMYPRQNQNRHEAVNLTPNTVEVRLFRGNMREERIRKAVEAVIAAVQWAKSCSGRGAAIAKSGQNDSLRYINYVDRHKELYPHLHSFIVQHPALRTVEDRPVSPELKEEIRQVAIREQQRLAQYVYNESNERIISDGPTLEMPAFSNFMSVREDYQSPEEVY